MSVDLTQNGTILHLQLAEQSELLDSIGNALVLEGKNLKWYLIKSLLYAGSALLQHVHLLVA